MSIVATSDLEHAPTRLLLVPLTSAIACVALADWLFFGWDVGISLALFLGVLGVVAVAEQWRPRRAAYSDCHGHRVCRWPRCAN